MLDLVGDLADDRAVADELAGDGIALFVEGKTEFKSLKPFFHKWLDPRLPEGSKVGFVPVNFSGVSKFIDGLAQRVHLYLEEYMADFVFGLIDLHGIP